MFASQPKIKELKDPPNQEYGSPDERIENVDLDSNPREHAFKKKNNGLPLEALRKMRNPLRKKALLLEHGKYPYPQFTISKIIASTDNISVSQYNYNDEF